MDEFYCQKCKLGYTEREAALNCCGEKPFETSVRNSLEFSLGCSGTFNPFLFSAGSGIMPRGMGSNYLIYDDYQEINPLWYESTPISG